MIDAHGTAETDLANGAGEAGSAGENFDKTELFERSGLHPSVEERLEG